LPDTTWNNYVAELLGPEDMYGTINHVSEIESLVFAQDHDHVEQRVDKAFSEKSSTPATPPNTEDEQICYGMVSINNAPINYTKII
jgi:hypothetical protein